MSTNTEREQAFLTAFLSVVSTASVKGLPIFVVLKGGEELDGIPTMEGWTPDTPPYGTPVTIGHTTIIAHEVVHFAMSHPSSVA
jgi:hypothetical protein